MYLLVDDASHPRTRTVVRDRSWIRTLLVLMVLTTFIALRAASASAHEGTVCETGCRVGVLSAK